MKKLYIENRPRTPSVRSLTAWFILSALTEITLGGIAAASSANYGLCLFVATLFVLPFVSLLPWTIRAEVKYRNNYSELLEEYRAKELSEKDYRALYKCARKHAGIRSMIVEAMQDGKLYYRDTEPLVEKINSLSASNGKGEKEKTVKIQQKLEKLIMESLGGTLLRHDESSPD